MKKIVLLIVLNVSFCFASTINNNLFNVLEDWNNANNKKNTTVLKSLYSSHLDYYTKKKESRIDVIKDKKKFFSKFPNFYQEVSNIEVEKLSKNRYKLHFNKKARLKKTQSLKTYYSFLIIDTSKKAYKIVIEGDQKDSKKETIQSVFYGSWDSDELVFSGKHTVYGLLKVVKAYGRPNYGETPEIDKVLKYYVLQLEKGITLNDSKTDKEKIVSEIQIMTDNSKKITKFIKNNTYVKVEGRFFASHLGHHIRDIIMETLPKNISKSNYQTMMKLIENNSIEGREEKKKQILTHTENPEFRKILKRVADEAYVKSACKTQTEIVFSSQKLNQKIDMNTYYLKCLQLVEINTRDIPDKKKVIKALE